MASYGPFVLSAERLPQPHIWMMSLVKRILKTFLAWSGALVWIGVLYACGYLWLGGFFYAKDAPLTEALLCAKDESLFYTPLGSGDMYLPSSCQRGVRQFRGSAADVAAMNGDFQGLYNVLYYPDVDEADKMLTFWLSRGANINVQSPITVATLIELVAKNNDTTLVSLLLKHGARTDIRNKAGQTPLEALRAYNERQCQSTEPNAGIVKLLTGNQ